MANSYNNITIIGRSTRDPEIRVVAKKNGEGSFDAASFSVATERPYFTRDANEKPETDFWDCEVMGKLSNYCKYLKKGFRVVVNGYIYNDKYTNKDGIVINKTKISVQGL